VVESEVLARIRSPELRAYVVWSPLLEGDDRAAAVEAAHHMDPRVRHFWDPSGRLGRELGATLRIPKRRKGRRRKLDGIAWDVYVVYKEQSSWSAQPSYWTHQLEQVDPAQVPRLDGATLLGKLQALLGNN
jgi:hypothetical protein